METLLCIALFLSFPILYKLLTQKGNNLPPSPLGLPLIGHLHLLKKPLHRNLAELSKQYGPAIFLRLGGRVALAITSSATFEDCFGKNDVVFSNRPPLLFGKYIGYNYTTMAMAPHGPHWRNLRRFAAAELFSSARVALSAPVREREVHSLVKQLFRSSRDMGFHKVQLRPRFSAVAYNIMTGMIAGKRYYGDSAEDSEDARRFREVTEEVFQLGLTSNLGDYFPWLRWFDLQGGVRKMKAAARKRDELLQRLMDERRGNAALQGEGEKTMIDVLLELQRKEPDYYTDEILMGIIWVLLTGATETSTIVLEWAMSLLLNHPEALSKVRAELAGEVGEGRVLTESDLPHLPYLRCIIYEALRLHPPTPVLPHMSSADCTVVGYHVPAGTMLLADVWAVHHDPELWEDAESFRPERFERVDAGSRDGFRWMPFGAGRRICPGYVVGTRMTSLALGVLLQCFEWRSVGEERVEMVERPTLAMFRARALEAMYSPRICMVEALSRL